jgi:hypothetical protein
MPTVECSAHHTTRILILSIRTIECIHLNDGAVRRKSSLDRRHWPPNLKGITTMTTRTLLFAALAAVTVAGPALADDRIDLTPTLYRDQARNTASVRPASELTTTPRLVPAAPANPRIVAEAIAR